MSESIELKLENNLDTKKLDTTFGTTEKKVSEAEVESSLNYDNLEPAEKAAIDEFISKVDITDTTMVLQYGSTAQNKISKFSDSVLDNVKTKETGEVGDLLTDLVVQIKDFDSDIPTGEDKGGQVVYDGQRIGGSGKCPGRQQTGHCDNQRPHTHHPAGLCPVILGIGLGKFLH